MEFQTLDVVVVETEKLHIPVPFRAVPAPRITWHKDGKELKTDERVGFRSVQQKHTKETATRDVYLLLGVVKYTCFFQQEGVHFLSHGG